MHKYNSYGTWEENNDFWNNNENKCIIYNGLNEKLNNNIKRNITLNYEPKGESINSGFNPNNNSNECLQKNRHRTNNPPVRNIRTE